MRVKYGIIVLVISVIVASATLTISAIAPAFPFSDVKGNTHENAIRTLYKEDMIFGKTAEHYAPNDVATRGETAQMFANALQLDTKNVQNPRFPDVPTTHAYYGAIAALENRGIVSGSDGLFMPNGNFKRSHAAKMLTLGFGLNKAEQLTSAFSDMPEHYETALFVQTLVNYKITQGTTATTFSPNNSLTRGHVATFLYRTIEETDNDLNITTVK